MRERAVSAVPTVEEITVLHPLSAAGGGDVLEDTQGAVGVLLVHEPDIAVAWRSESRDFEVGGGAAGHGLGHRLSRVTTDYSAAELGNLAEGHQQSKRVPQKPRNERAAADRMKLEAFDLMVGADGIEPPTFAL